MTTGKEDYTCSERPSGNGRMWMQGWKKVRGFTTDDLNSHNKQVIDQLTCYWNNYPVTEVEKTYIYIWFLLKYNVILPKN